MNQAISQNKDIMAVLITTLGILSLPLLAMQLGNEVQWTAFDFLVMGMMLMTTGTLLVVASRKITNIGYRYFAMISVLAAFLMLWVLAATD